MGLSCCCKDTQVEDKYYVSDTSGRIVKVFRGHCTNPKCKAQEHKGLVLEIHAGIITKSSNVLRGFEALAFDTANPKPKIPIVINQAPDKAAWVFGKGFERINKTKKLKTVSQNSYSLLTGKKYKEESKKVVCMA